MAGTDDSKQPSPSDPLTFATDLSQYYTRFDKHVFSEEFTRLLSHSQIDTGSITITEADVRHPFKRIKTSAESLSPFFSAHFPGVYSHPLESLSLSILFVDFLSAFDTVQRHTTVDKLQELGVHY